MASDLPVILASNLQQRNPRNRGQYNIPLF
jgi:hypothetical protein